MGYEFLETQLADMTLEDLPDVEETVSWLEKVTPTVLHYLKLFLICIVIYLIGKRLIRVVLRIMHRSFERAKVEEGLAGFLEKLVKIGLYLLLVTIMAGILGLETSSLVAVVGSAGLAVGLALQGSLSNLAGGVLILISKPFVLGDTISTPYGDGTVASIGMIYTRLQTVDNRMIVIPNGILANGEITNTTMEKERMLELEFDVSYDAKLAVVRELLKEQILKQQQVLKEKETKVFVKALAASSVTVCVRMWVKTEDYWDLKWSFIEQVKELFEQNQIEIPYQQLDVHVVNAGQAAKEPACAGRVNKEE